MLSLKGSTKGTGMWPMCRRRPWDLTPSAGEGVLIDPVCVAWAAAESLEKTNWPGIDLMEEEFYFSIIDQPDETVNRLVEEWYVKNQDAVCQELRARLSTYNFDALSATARAAMTEAIQNYQAGNHLSVVRVLLPEFEAFARQLYAAYDGSSQQLSQAKAIKYLKEAIGSLPITGTAAIESVSLSSLFFDKLFASCHTFADAAALGEAPNRHAEVHGLASYGTLKGATSMLCVMSLLLQFIDRLLTLSSSPASPT